MRDPSGTRLVPMTKAQRDRLHLHGWRNESDAYDAAPGDPAEAVRVIVQSIASLRDPYDAIDDTTVAILAALGVPANPANEDHE